MNRDEPKDKKDKRLGQYLSLDRGTLEELLEIQKQPSPEGRRRRLGDLLLERGLYDEADVLGAVRNQRLDRLEVCRLFAGAGVVELAEISNHVSERSFEAGEVFIEQDTLGDRFYLLIRGRAEVFRQDEFGEDVVLSEIEPGESVGELGYFSDGWRTASVRAVRPSEVLEIRYSELEAIFGVSPTLTRNLLKMVTGRLRQTTLRFQDVVQKERLAERSLSNLRQFLDMSEISTLSQGIEGLIQRVVVTASRVMDADRATLFLIDRLAGELWSKVAEGVQHKEIRVPIGSGVAGWAARHGELVNIEDAYQDERFDPSVDKATGYRTRSMLCGPVTNLAGEVVGVVQVINKRGGRFDDRDEALFKAFVYQTAIALENFRLYRRLLQNHHRMGVMLDLTTSMAQTLDLDALIIKIVNKITDILSSERATLFLIDDERDELWSKAAVGDELTEIRFPKNLGLAGHTATTGQTLNIKDAYADPRFNPDVDRQTGFTSRSILTMPVINRDGKLIGVTQAINKKEGVFESDDESLLKALTSQVAVALENAQLYRRTVSMKNYLASVQDSISNAILTLDPDRRVVTANRPAQRMFDLDMSTLKGVPLHELIGPENARFASLLEWVSQSGRPTIDYDVDLTLKNGDLHSVNVNLVPLVDPSEEHEGLVLVFEDITQEKRVKGALTRYMAKDIVDRVLEDPSGEALGGAAGTATTMFADIRGFTGLAEGMSAEETVEFLNHYFSLMVEVIFEQRGVLDKYIGDAIMAVFGVPYQQGDDAARAVQTALRMRSVLAGINAERLAAQRAPIRVGFGLCTGEVIYGNIGSAKRMDYTVIGDGVNVAARLEALTAAYGVDILISESTQQRIGDWFTTRPVDQVLFKGKKNPVEVYQVLGEGRWRLSQAEEYFSEGLQHYRDRRFDQAARAFQAGRAGDNLCRVFLERCRYFQECPPPPDWDGVWITDRK